MTIKSDNSEHRIILVQHQDKSKYNDFVGKYYNFPKKYLPIIAEGEEFIYFDNKKNGGTYFGCGKLGKTFSDKSIKGNYFVEILDYRPFSKHVAFHDVDKRARESSKFFNKQNAVRRITSDEYDNIFFAGEALAHFKADAHLLTVLGEQLIASEKVGVLELIKNAYDAGAMTCRVLIENVPGLDPANREFPSYGPGPVVVIEDDGSGMTMEDIENGWLRAASTKKTVVKQQIRRIKENAQISIDFDAIANQVDGLKRNNFGRIPLGEKGVGRFAAHRLGRFLELVTKSASSKYEYVLSIDWDRFLSLDTTELRLDEIGVAITRRDPERNYGDKGSGTRLVIYGGKKDFYWTKESIADLNEAILLLNSPVIERDKDLFGFKASFGCPQIELDKKLAYERTPAPFTFEAQVNSSGVLSYKMEFVPGDAPLPRKEWAESDFDLRLIDNKDRTIWAENGILREPKCGPFSMKIAIWLRKKPWLHGPDASIMKEYLDFHGGVSVYRDDFLVFSSEAGKEQDWLGLATRHIKKGTHISYYNILGHININQIDNYLVVDQTDRQRFIGNEASRDLATLVSTVISTVIESHVAATRDQLEEITSGAITDTAKLKMDTEQSAAILDTISDLYSFESDPLKILNIIGSNKESAKDRIVDLGKSLTNLKASIQRIEDSHEKLVDMAGYGLSIAVSVHELAKITANFYHGIDHFIKNPAISKEDVEKLSTVSQSVKSELSRLSPIRAVKSEQATEFNVASAVRYAGADLAWQFKKLGIEFSIVGEEGFGVYAKYGITTQVFMNLIENACYWLKVGKESPKKIVVMINQGNRTVTVADNGPGISMTIRPYLFNIGASLKMPPSGLGLYISRFYMKHSDGSIYETHDRERLSNMVGAQFTVDFSRVKSSKER